MKASAASFDVIINTVSVDLDWNVYLALLRAMGTLVQLGAPAAHVAMKSMSRVLTVLLEEGVKY